MNDNRQSFAARWSRRKASRLEDQERPELGQAVLAESDFADVDFSALDINSDFTRFMHDNVPDSIRNRALQMLWASSDVIGTPDDLDDFLEDFTEQAKALPPELARSAYKIGAGFVVQETKSDGTGGDNGEAEAEPEMILPQAPEVESEKQSPEVAQSRDTHADDV